MPALHQSWADQHRRQGVVVLTAARGDPAASKRYHPAGRAPGVEWLGGGAKDDVGLVEVFEDLGQATDGAGKAVDTVDEQEVKAAEAGLGDRTLELGAVEAAAAHLEKRRTTSQRLPGAYRQAILTSGGPDDERI